MHRFITFFNPVVLLVLFTTLTSCSNDDNDEPTVDSSNALLGVWQYAGKDAWDFIEFKENNKFEYYENNMTWDLNGNIIAYTEANKYLGYYFYDAIHNLLILHFSQREPNDWVEIYEVDRLTESRLTYIIIDDISKLYKSSSFIVEKDKQICDLFYEEGYHTDPDDDTELYIRSTSKELDEYLDKFESFRIFD